MVKRKRAGGGGGGVLNVKGKKNTGNRIQSDRKAAVEHWSGGKRRSADCEQEDGVTAANQISLSLGCLMSILLCDSHLTTLSTMNTRSTRFSIASLLLSQIKEGTHQNGTKNKRGGEREEKKRCLRLSGELSFMCERCGSQNSPL